MKSEAVERRRAARACFYGRPNPDEQVSTLFERHIFNDVEVSTCLHLIKVLGQS
jgi:hypothetical protein